MNVFHCSCLQNFFLLKNYWRFLQFHFLWDNIFYVNASYSLVPLFWSFYPSLWEYFIIFCAPLLWNDVLLYKDIQKFLKNFQTFLAHWGVCRLRVYTISVNSSQCIKNWMLQLWFPEQVQSIMWSAATDWLNHIVHHSQCSGGAAAPHVNNWKTCRTCVVVCVVACVCFSSSFRFTRVHMHSCVISLAAQSQYLFLTWWRFFSPHKISQNPLEGGV